MATALYGAIVAQARARALYADFEVPDTVTGRFEMVVLHSYLVIDRLKRAGMAGKAMGQEVFDEFCRDMDQSLRELGFGDMAVPKRMKQLGESYYGRAEAYGQSLGDPARLAAAIGRNVFPEAANAVTANALAAYAMAAAEQLTGLPDAVLLAGRAEFPDAAAFAGTEAGP
jgi:cytochrome b pre-mRNA-processing protein 3